MQIQRLLYTPATLLLLFVLSQCQFSIPDNSPPAVDMDTTTISVPPGPFGLSMDTLYAETSTIRRNQTFAQIMLKLGTDPNLIDEIEKNDTDFNVAKIKAGVDQTVIRSQRDSAALYWIYQPDPVNWIRIKLTSPAEVTAGKKPVRYLYKALHGEIHSSLWNTAQEMNFPYDLALQLSDIYAWTIDFFDLKEGDTFDVLYEESYVDTVYTGIPRIFAARFSNDGHEIYAIPFIQDSSDYYYDLEGNSLRRAFLKAPLRFNRISSRFSYSRMHPILKIRRPHLGVDYAAPIGTPVHTVGDGKVISMRQTSGSGRMVKIRHNSVYTTAYLHLSRYGKGLYTGKSVKQGDIIGYVGSSGLSTGPHLDFRFYKNGSPVDPLKVKSPPVVPVKQENMAAFDSVRTVMVRLLNTVK